MTVGGEGVEEVVNYVQKKKENLWLVQPPSFPKRDWDVRLIDLSQRLKIVQVSVERVTFIDRSVFQMNVRMEPHVEDSDTLNTLNTQPELAWLPSASSPHPATARTLRTQSGAYELSTLGKTD